MSQQEQNDFEIKPFDLKTCPSTGFLSELWLFVRLTGKWWLVPVLVALLLLGLVVLVSGSVCAPLLYTLF